MPDYCSINQDEKLPNGGIESSLNSDYLSYFSESTQKFKNFVESHPSEIAPTEAVAFDRVALERILSDSNIKTLVFYFGIRDDKSLTLHLIPEKGNFTNLNLSSFVESNIQQTLSQISDSVYCCPEGRPPTT